MFRAHEEKRVTNETLMTQIFVGSRHTREATYFAGLDKKRNRSLRLMEEKSKESQCDRWLVSALTTQKEPLKR